MYKNIFKNHFQIAPDTNCALSTFFLIFTESKPTNSL